LSWPLFPGTPASIANPVPVKITLPLPGDISHPAAVLQSILMRGVPLPTWPADTAAAPPAGERHCWFRDETINWLFALFIGEAEVEMRERMIDRYVVSIVML
jgi:hypothetical protein